MLIYRIQAGDTLTAVCQRFSVQPDEVVRINDLSSPDRLAVGQALILPTDTHPYVVQQGETLQSIANRLGESLERLYEDNPTLRNRQLLSGETIFVTTPPPKLGRLELNGYAYTNIDTAVLDVALPYLTYLTVFSYGVRTDGGLVEVEDEELIARAKTYNTAPIMLLSTIGEDGKFNSQTAQVILEDEGIQQILIGTLLQVLRQKGYRGVDVDFEYIPESLATAYAEFIGRLHTALSAEGYLLFVALAPQKPAPNNGGLLYEAHNYELLGAVCDRALIMTYEWGYTYGPPMAIAPLNEVRRVLQYGVSAIPPEKILMGLPNYAYDWPLPFVEGQTAAKSMGNPAAATLAGTVGTEIQFDEKAASPYYRYTAEGIAHEVWFEDAGSVEAKLRLIREFKLAGGGVWNIMRPFGQLFYLADYYFDIVKSAE